MSARTYVFKNLLDARSSLVGKTELIKIEAPQAFAASNAAGDLRRVESLDEIGTIAEASALRLKQLL
jgi:hypothetical protein